MTSTSSRLAAGALLLVSACGGSSAHSTLTSQAPPPSPAAAAPTVDPAPAETGQIGADTGRGAEGSGRAANHSSTVPQVHIGQPESAGDLDKAILRRYIKQNLPKISACYQQELAKTPGLEGTIHVLFFIAPNGTVANSQANGVSPEVSSCVAAVIKAIEFPKPKGGGGTQVDYPFSFRTIGGGV